MENKKLYNSSQGEPSVTRNSFVPVNSSKDDVCECGHEERNHLEHRLFTGNKGRKLKDRPCCRCGCEKFKPKAEDGNGE